MKLDDLFGKEQLFENVDWSRTKAYALGLGGIYINVEGREADGIVGPDEYETVRQAIIDGLESYVDPATGKKPVFKVYRREECYTGYDANEMPDLRVANSRRLPRVVAVVAWRHNGRHHGAQLQQVVGRPLLVRAVA